MRPKGTTTADRSGNNSSSTLIGGAKIWAVRARISQKSTIKTLKLAEPPNRKFLDAGCAVAPEAAPLE